MRDVYKQFEKNLNDLLSKEITSLAIAVSGGSDSIALVCLLDRLVQRALQNYQTLNILVLTVDHHLRPESKEECEYVAQLSHSLGYKCITLSWDAQNKFSNLQGRARAGRYDLMSDICKQHGIAVLLTAHHLDDNIENFLLRKKRKSGLFGLSSPNVSYLNQITIIRPLYNISKKQLVDYLILNKIKWFEDSSNFSDKYERNKIRKMLNNQSEDFKTQVIAEQQKIDQEVIALKILLNKALVESCIIYDYGFCVIKLEILKTFPDVIKLQLFAYIFTIIGGRLMIPRARLLYPILGILKQNVDFIRTLHGCSVKKVGKNLLIYRMFGKNLPLNVKFINNSWWDNKFILQCDIGQKQNYQISHLTEVEYHLIKDNLDLKFLAEISFKHHKEILLTLPLVKKLEKIIALPHISFYNEANFVGKIKLLYYPKFTSRFIQFP